MSYKRIFMGVYMEPCNLQQFGQDDYGNMIDYDDDDLYYQMHFSMWGHLIIIDTDKVIYMGVS